MKKPKPKFIVLKDGVPCGFARPSEVGLGHTLANGFQFRTKLVGKRGILVKRPDAPHHFGGEKSANKFAGIAARVAGQLRGTMVDMMPKLQPVVEAGVFTVRKECE